MLRLVLFAACLALLPISVHAVAQPVPSRTTLDRFTKMQNPPLYRAVKAKSARLAKEADELVEQRKFEQAEPLLYEALDLLLTVDGRSNLDALVMANNYAFVIEQIGWLTEARMLYSRLFDNAQASLGKQSDLTLSVLDNYGNVVERLGRHSEAELYRREALFRKRTKYGRDDSRTLQSLEALARNLCNQDRCGQAKPLAQQALDSRLASQDHNAVETLSSKELIALIDWKLGRTDTTELLLRQVVAGKRAALPVSDPGLAASLNLLANFLHDSSRFDEALPLATEAYQYALQSEEPNSLVTLRYQANRSALLFELGRLNEALPGLRMVARQRIEMLPEGHPQTIQSLGNLATALLMAGKAADGLEKASKAIEWSRKQSNVALSSDLKARDALAASLEDRQSLEKLYVDALWAQELHAEESSRQALIALQFASNNPASEAVKDAAASRFAAQNNVSELVIERETLLQAWADKDAESLSLIDANAADVRIERNKDELITIRRDIAKNEETLRARLPEYFTIVSDQVVRFDELTAVLNADEAIVMLVPTDRGTHAMAVTDKGIEWSRSDWDGSTIAAKVDELREGLEVTGGGRLPVFDFEQAHELYAELIAPVESALEGKQRVYVVADGALSRLPLGVLLTEKLDAADVASGNGDAESADDPVRGTMLGGGPSTTESAANDPEDFARASWLADRYALVNLPSLQSLVFIRTFGLSDEDIEGAGYTGFGDPVLARHASQNGSRSAGLGGSVDAATMLARGSSGDALMNPASLKQMASLPGTKRELEQVSQLLGASDTSLFLGAAMTEPEIREADLSRTRILHLATHGLTSEEGGRLGDLAEPGLVFTPPEQSSEANDGYLAASEVVGLNLSLADWVILSACNTAAPSGKAGETGLSGLAQAFFYAGAESLLVSHWPVFDSVAPILTAETLARAQQGTPRAEAFQQAMQQVRTTNPHPAAWAPFVLVGEGR